MCRVGDGRRGDGEVGWRKVVRLMGLKAVSFWKSRCRMFLYIVV